MSQIDPTTPAWLQRKVSTRSRLRGAGAALGLLAGLGAVGAARPAAADAPMVYYAGTNPQGLVMIGGALFTQPAGFVVFSFESLDNVVYTHFILAAETWLYDGTYQFVTTAPYRDLTNSTEFAFVLSARSYDYGLQSYTNAVSIRLGGSE